MSRLLLFIMLHLLLFICCSMSAQQLNEDSLRNIISKGKVQQKDILIYRQLASSYAQRGSYDSAVTYYKAGLQNAQILKNDYWVTKYTLWSAGIYIANTQYDSATHYLARSFPLVQKINNDSLLATYYQNMGTLYMYQNKNDLAADNTLKSIEILEKMGDKTYKSLLLKAYSNLSGIFNVLKQHDKALVYDKKSLQYKNTDEVSGELAALYFNVAATYHKTGDVKNMKLYLDSAQYFNNKYPNPRALLNIMTGLGIYYEMVNNIDSALVYHNKAMNISKQSGNFYFFAERAVNAAAIYHKKGNLSKSIALLEEALPYAKQYQDIFMIGEVYKGMKEIAAAKGNYKDAYTYAGLSQQYIDSASNAATQQTVLDLEARYQNEKKEKEISGLRLDNTQKQLAAVQRSRILVIGGIAAAASFIILLLLYRNSRNKRYLAEKDKLLKEEKIKFLEEQQQVVSLQSMINGQETERTRIAKDLHDGLGGFFSTVKMYFSALRHEQPALAGNELFNKSSELLNTASNEVRRIAHNMMPEVLLKVGLIQAVEDLCNSINAGKLLGVSMQHYGMDKRLSSATEIMLFRILQELLNNIIKHSEATKAIIQFNRSGNVLTVSAEDNGRGFNLQENNAGIHAGLESVRSRVNYLNGQLSIDSEKETGTTIIMQFLIAG